MRALAVVIGLAVWACGSSERTTTTPTTAATTPAPAPAVRSAAPDAGVLASRPYDGGPIEGMLGDEIGDDKPEGKWGQGNGEWVGGSGSGTGTAPPAAPSSGTLGTGTFETGGTGGTGSGFGGRGGKWPPEISVGSPTVGPAYGKPVIRRVIHRAMPRLRFCYERRLLAEPALAGRVTARFRIAGDGAVAKADASGLDAEVASCVAEVIRTLRFPAPPGGGVLDVSYPFVFRPTE